MTPLRSFLFVPGDHADRLAKAHTRGSEAVVVDLEDSVATAARAAALTNAEEWLRDRTTGDRVESWVRINGGELGLSELERLVRLPALSGVYVPKAESAGQLTAIARVAGRRTPAPLIAPMIESAVGLARLAEVAGAPGVYQLHLGEVDLAADLGAALEDDNPLFHQVRAQVVVASRAAGLPPPVAPVRPSLDGTEVFTASTRALARMGFHGRDCIHPDQVAATNDVFVPDLDELSWAREVLAAADGGPGSFRGPDGAMVDEAVLRRARRLLASDDAPSRDHRTSRST